MAVCALHQPADKAVASGNHDHALVLQIKQSQLATVVMFLSKCPDETPENRRMAADLVLKWFAQLGWGSGGTSGKSRGALREEHVLSQQEKEVRGRTRGRKTRVGKGGESGEGRGCRGCGGGGGRVAGVAWTEAFSGVRSVLSFCDMQRRARMWAEKQKEKVKQAMAPTGIAAGGKMTRYLGQSTEAAEYKIIPTSDISQDAKRQATGRGENKDVMRALKLAQGKGKRK